MVRCSAGCNYWSGEYLKQHQATLVAASPPNRQLFPNLIAARRRSTWNGVRRGAKALATATWLSLGLVVCASEKRQTTWFSSMLCCSFPESKFATVCVLLRFLSTLALEIAATLNLRRVTFCCRLHPAPKSSRDLPLNRCQIYVCKRFPRCAALQSLAPVYFQISIFNRFYRSTPERHMA